MLLASARWAAASIFRMPAMSPTMTEGGIVLWKVEPGKEFAAGDVLLEVETDKATIDVEAQDDGILWEILKQDGEKGISVGVPIAYLAEPGDELGSLEKPKDELVEKSEKKEETVKKAEASTGASGDSEASSLPSGSSGSSASSESSSGLILGKADASQTLLPSVEFLLHVNKITREEALANIQASGPKGRLLKGDVLAYLGKIKTDSIVANSEWIHAREHLDLSNIVLAESKPVTDATKGANDAQNVETKPAPPSTLVEFTVTRSLKTDDDELYTPSDLKQIFEIDILDAESEVYLTKFPQYAFSPSAQSVSGGVSGADALFDELLAPPPTAKRFEVVSVDYKFHNSGVYENSEALDVSSGPVDFFDELVAIPSKPSGGATSFRGSDLVDVTVKVKYNEKLADAAAFVKQFERELEV